MFGPWETVPGWAEKVWGALRVDGLIYWCDISCMETNLPINVTDTKVDRVWHWGAAWPPVRQLGHDEEVEDEPAQHPRGEGHQRHQAVHIAALTLLVSSCLCLFVTGHLNPENRIAARFCMSDSFCFRTTTSLKTTKESWRVAETPMKTTLTFEGGWEANTGGKSLITLMLPFLKGGQ